MTNDTAAFIMALKDNHNLFDVSDLPTHKDLAEAYNKNLLDKAGDYFYLAALYASDHFDCPIDYYYKNPWAIRQMVKSAVLDYITTCDDPRYVLWYYFDTREHFSEDRFDDIWCWCSALAEQSVKLFNGREFIKYINGFTAENTCDYSRKNKYFGPTRSELGRKEND